MKAIVVRQPWATLIALGVKTIETRPGPPNGPMRPDGVRGLPGCTLERGERIAIVAGADRSTGRIRSGSPEQPMLEAAWLELKQAAALGPCAPQVPLGAVVCTVVVADALPIVASGDEGAIRTIDNDGASLWIADPVRYPANMQEAGTAAWNEYLSTFPPGSTGFTDPARWEEFCDVEGLAFDVEQREATEQLPLGDFEPGRWGWMLTDSQPCEPTPCKGRQGVFELPVEVAAMLRDGDQ